MGFVTRALILLSMVACLTSVAHAIAGQATFYTPSLPSACLGNPGNGAMIAAANRSLFANGTACGTRYRMTCTGTNTNLLRPCTGNSVDVTIVDVCVTCSPNEFQLSQEAFAVIATTDARRINIDYTRI